jgi:hypothetical protein
MFNIEIPNSKGGNKKSQIFKSQIPNTACSR